MEILRVENLCKTYGSGEIEVNALKNVSFQVEQGEFIVIIGESGSGKSTLLNCLGGIDQPTSGTVLIKDKDLLDMAEDERTIFRRRNIGFIFQNFNLIPELNVENNILFPLLLDQKKPNEDYIKDIMSVLGLTERKKHLPNQLSGGQQQRVAIGRALITKPAIILADEPTGNLDRKNSDEVISLLRMASKKYHQTVIMITHNPAITSSADRVFQMSDGVLKDFGGNSNE